MKSYKSFILTILVILSGNLGLAQGFLISSKTENVEIKKDSSFVTEITIAFKKSQTPRVYPILFDTELEKVFNIRLYKKKKKRLKELEIGKIHEENVELEYIASKKVKIIKIPKDEEIHLKYSVSCNELMYFSSLSFFSYNKIDTLKYQIKIPKKFDLFYKIIYRDSLDYFSMDLAKTKLNSV